MGKVIMMEIKAEELDGNWIKVSGILKPAVDRNETMTLKDVYFLVKEKRAKLIVAIKKGSIFAAFLIERVKGLSKSYLRVVLAAGEPMREWIDTFIKMMDGMSRQENVTFYEMVGRPGWKRALKDIGYESALIYRRKV